MKIMRIGKKYNFIQETSVTVMMDKIHEPCNTGTVMVQIMYSSIVMVSNRELIDMA
jgi:hypothetical protein